MKYFIPREEIPNGEPPCHYCNARCCRYIALPFDRPENYEEFDFVRWFLSHRGMSLFLDGEIYYLLAQTPCRYLDQENRCTVYSRRPQICRDYSSQSCEYGEENPYEGYFEHPDQVEEYAEAVLGPRLGRSFRSPEDPSQGW